MEGEVRAVRKGDEKAAVGAQPKIRSYLIISDTHEGYEQMKEAATLAKKEKLDVINLGDYIADWKSEKEDLISRIEKQTAPFDGVNVLTVPGNHDLYENVQEAIKKHPNVSNIHDSVKEFEDLAFVGFGGSEKPGDHVDKARAHYTYDEVRSSMEKNVKKALEKYKAKDIVTVLHSPVRGFMDETYVSLKDVDTSVNPPIHTSPYDGHKEVAHVKTGKNGRQYAYVFIGSKGARDVVEKNDVGFVMSGHKHSGAGLVLRIRGKGEEKRVYGNSLEDGLYENQGVKVTKTKKSFLISYNPEDVNVTAFLNPGSLGYDNKYAVMKVKDTEKERDIYLDFTKLGVGKRKEPSYVPPRPPKGTPKDEARGQLETKLNERYSTAKLKSLGNYAR